MDIFQINYSTMWCVATGLLLGVEMMTGTFYLLMLAIGLGAGALTAYSGYPLMVQFLVASLVGFGAVTALNHYKRMQPAKAPAESNPDVNMDVGQTVHVQSWQADGTTQVKYRGVNWIATLQEGQVAEPGLFVISKVIGSHLGLEKAISH